jgi:hypothetical protein
MLEKTPTLYPLCVTYVEAFERYDRRPDFETAARLEDAEDALVDHFAERRANATMDG